MEGPAPTLTFRDYSTWEGRLTLCFHRMKWRYFLPPALFLAAFAGVAVLIASSMEPEPNTNQQQQTPGNSLIGIDNFELPPVPGWTIVEQPTPDTVEAEGCENGYYPFEGFSSSIPSPTIKFLKIRNLLINAEEFTRSLQEWRSLESIVMENVWVDGNFSRVYLPHLNKFIYHQFRNGKTDEYKEPDVLKQILFFDKSPVQSWDLMRDLLNLNMSIQVTVEGNKILDIEPDFGEISINTHYCEDMLVHFDSRKTFPLSTLSLHWCPVTSQSIEALRRSGDTLQFLFLNNAVPSSTPLLGEVIRSLPNLKELHLFQRYHCDWPGYETYLNVSQLPPTLETLSVTNLDLSWGSLGRNSIRNLSLDQYVGEEVVNNFPEIFPKLRTIALFNITQNRSYLLMEQLLFRVDPPPQLIIVTDVTRIRISGESYLQGKWTALNNNAKVENNDGGRSRANIAAQTAASKVEQLLRASGIPENASSFQLELSRDDGDGDKSSYVGRELSTFQRNFLRFQRLAFRKLDTYSDYVTWDKDPK